MKVAAFQAPLSDESISATLDLLAQQVHRCELEEVSLLCFPEGILGGLADNSHGPIDFAIRGDMEDLSKVLSPLSSKTVTSIVGFTELGEAGKLYNSAAVFHRGEVAGLYRKLHPAINRSVYEAGHDFPVFEVEGMKFGIVICNDSNFSEPARRMAAQGARVLFVPANNALPAWKAKPERVAADARRADRARAIENGLWVVRADVAGDGGNFVSYGSTEIVDPDGLAVQAALSMTSELIFADITP